ncbi:hypothetical protein AJ85_08245 [Alkalihalobacillus alcalophilus ATCC 27647 = CGMCC 1.3604]|uniref:Uncharacterized protein n=1 Tax=Alkalihalobacillus alcalophilus ATCC 27647 = CGMCC 1.3604 TaxID=1218173 RepID=A0A094WRA2_ALKAL|nr:hypothetical protein [Alkalihalobacillus alcalophilus]KGA98593.1 hypothetical protein BALCAV_0203660 [Alkalihalobacillus alcalophilus ATCC 27647 = CGMCC 1.3604]MED1560436.1 hypothetical protein [Alkalihalobacillus alcalophilus]THG90884.1 hypothetical protein AJ85_08245 [Alkalihalobacillus alcalophilus ATCC 27647 = CGMCC 1.3604]
MSAWIQLVKKEFRLGIGMLYAVLAGTLVITTVSFIASIIGGMPFEQITMFALLLLFFHLFFLIIYLLNSLQKEKLQFWLHNPLPGYALLLAKIAAGVISMVLSMIFTTFLFFIPILLGGLSFSLDQSGVSVLPEAITLFLSLFVNFSLQMTVVFLFFWVIYLCSQNYLNTGFSFILTLFLFLLSMFIYGQFTQTSFFSSLTNWGLISLENTTSWFNFTHSIDKISITLEQTSPSFYMGRYVIEGLILIGLFFVTSWLLDRKIEV